MSRALLIAPLALASCTLVDGSLTPAPPAHVPIVDVAPPVAECVDAGLIESHDVVIDTMEAGDFAERAWLEELLVARRMRVDLTTCGVWLTGEWQAAERYAGDRQPLLAAPDTWHVEMATGLVWGGAQLSMALGRMSLAIDVPFEGHTERVVLHGTLRDDVTRPAALVRSALLLPRTWLLPWDAVALSLREPIDLARLDITVSDDATLDANAYRRPLELTSWVAALPPARGWRGDLVRLDLAAGYADPMGNVGDAVSGALAVLPAPTRVGDVVTWGVVEDSTLALDCDTETGSEYAGTVSGFMRRIAVPEGTTFVDVTMHTRARAFGDVEDLSQVIIGVHGEDGSDRRLLFVGSRAAEVLGFTERFHVVAGESGEAVVSVELRDECTLGDLEVIVDDIALSDDPPDEDASD